MFCTTCNSEGNIIINETYCINCPSNCVSCVTNNECQICENNYYLDQNKQCVVNCDVGYFSNDLNHTCDKCDDSCSRCFGKSNYECFSCLLGYSFYSNSCLSQCPNGTFLNKFSLICEGFFSFILKKILNFILCIFF